MHSTPSVGITRIFLSACHACRPTQQRHAIASGPYVFQGFVRKGPLPLYAAPPVVAMATFSGAFEPSAGASSSSTSPARQSAEPSAAGCWLPGGHPSASASSSSTTPLPRPPSFYTTLSGVFPSEFLTPDLAAAVQGKIRKKIRDIGWKVKFPPAVPGTWQMAIESFAMVSVHKCHEAYGHHPWFFLVPWPLVVAAAAAEWWRDFPYGSDHDRWDVAMMMGWTEMQAIMLRRIFAGTLSPCVERAERLQAGVSTVYNLDQLGSQGSRAPGQATQVTSPSTQPRDALDVFNRWQ